MAETQRGLSLRTRVTALALAAVALTWIVAATAAWLGARHEADELLDGYLVQTASVLQSQLGDDLDESELEHAPELHRYARRVVFQVWDRGGRLRLHSTNAPDTRLSPRDEGFDDVALDGRRYRVFTSADRERRRIVQVAEARDARDKVARGIAGSLAAPVAVALPVLALALWIGIGAGMRPLSAVSREIAARDPENLAPVADAGAPREIVPLVQSLNRLFERVTGSLERERRFTADAAHELRTPIAALRVQAQVAAGARDARERDRALAQVLAGCDRSTRLVEQMLTLARLDPRAGVEHDALCDLAAVARGVVAEHAPLAVERSVDIGFQGGETRVAGDASLLAVLVRNLVDNAIRHTPPGGSVRVAVEAPGGGPVLTVTDTGPGAPDEVLARLGERFYRPAGEEAPGSGLGLSIVRRIAELHRADVRFARGAGEGGLEVRVIFPRPR